MIIIKEVNVRILSKRINEGVIDKGLGLKAFYSIFYAMDLCWDDKNLPYFMLFLESSYFYYIFHTRLILNESAIKSDQLGFVPKALALQTPRKYFF